MHTSILLQKEGGIFWVPFPTVGRFSLYKRKFSELWLLPNLEPQVGV